MLKKELEKLGLSEKEASVYLAAIQTGPSSVQKISQKSKVNRATAYVIIESLTEMGMMSTYDEGKKTFYVAEKPQRLIEHFSQKEKNLHAKIEKLKGIVPELNLLYNDYSDKPKIRYFEGIEGLMAVQDDFTSNLSKDDVLYIFLPLDDFANSALKGRFKGKSKERIVKGVKTKALYTSRNGRNLEYEIKNKRDQKEYKFIDYKENPFNGGMNIYGNKIFIIDYLGKLGGVVIENKTMADMMKTIFKKIWDLT